MFADDVGLLPAHMFTRMRVCVGFHACPQDSRHGGAAGRRHADHPEARRRLYQRQHQTGLRRRAAGAWTHGAGPPRLTTPRWPSTSASSSRRAARPPPPPWPSPPSGFEPSSPASRPPPGKRPPACWAATVARPPTGAGARPPPLRADGLAAILATAARPRTDGRGAPPPSHPAPHGSPQLASAPRRASDRRPTPRLRQFRRAATQQAG